MLPCAWNLHMYNPCNIFISILAIVQFRKRWPGAIQVLHSGHRSKFQIQMPTGAPNIYDHARKTWWKSSSAKVIPKFAGVLQIKLKSYNIRFICDIIDCSTISHEKQTISRLFLFYIFAWMVLFLFLLLQCGKTHLLNSQFSLTQNNQLRLKTTSLKSH